VEGKTVQEMPLNGRNTMNLIALVPGVVPQGASQGSTSMNQSDHSSNSGWGNYQIGGSIAGQGVIFVDGAPNNILGGNGVGFVPTQDAIQEFKVSTSTASPEFGRYGGGVVEMTTKSGTNQFHGAAYEYLRNADLNANIYDNIIHNQPRQKWNQNQYGGEVGGPVKKDKIFFMFSWEQFASRVGYANNTNIPDAGMRATGSGTSAFNVPGNLTAHDPVRFRNYGVTTCIDHYDPVANRTYYVPACLDQTALKFINYYPSLSSPYYHSNVAIGNGNFYNQYVVGDNNYQYNVRGDIKLTEKQQLFLRFTKANMSDIPADPMGSANGLNTGNADSHYNTMQGVIGDTYTINPTTIADVRLSYLRMYSDNLQGSAGSSAAKSFVQSLGSGWSGVASAAPIIQLPKIAPGGFMGGPDGLYTFRAMFLYSQDWYDNYVLSASITKIKGNHTFKFGGEIRLLDAEVAGSQNPTGSISTSGGQGSNYTTDEWANLILGLPDNIAMGTASSVANMNWYQGYYANDTWSVNRKLTINAGLRWELPGGVGERHDRGTVLLPDLINPSTGIRGTLALVNSPQWRDRTTEPALHALISPRLGVAYRLTNNTVVRGGYSLFYIAPDMSAASGATSVLPSSSTINSAATQANNSQNSVSYTIANPFAGLPINMPVGRSWGTANFINSFQAAYANAGQSLSGPVPTTILPYMEQWNLTVGQQFKGQQSIEVGYAGALGIHLLPAGGTWGMDELDAASAKALGAGTITPAQASARMPFPAYFNVTNGNAYNGTTNYNSLQVRYEKRFSSGLITSGYTRSKLIGDADTPATFLDSGADGTAQDYNNIKAERSLLSFSMKNRWVTSYVLNLPFGRGKKFAGNVNGAADRLIGGWAVNGITLLQSGQPLMLTAGSNNYTRNWGAGALRPNVVAGCTKTRSGSAQSRLNQWFNTSCFTVPADYTLGNESRVDSALTGSGQANWDFSALKSTKITETTNLQFRVEFFNIFNRRQWANPSLDASNPHGFGAVQSGRNTMQQNSPRQIQASLRFTF
jgi:hypothetical protein